jgi:hypothetical protein
VPGRAASHIEPVWGVSVILIWGFRVVFRTLATGTFFCPRCGGDRQYRTREARRFFTFFFIPLIPLTRLGQVVECDTCHKQFEEQVLSLPTSAQLTHALQYGMGTLIAAVLRAGDATDGRARELAIDAVLGTGAAGFDDAALTRLLSGQHPELTAALGPLAGQLEPAGREAFLTKSVRVALADGTVTEAQRDVLTVAGSALQMTPAHVTGVIETAIRTAQS